MVVRPNGAMMALWASQSSLPHWTLQGPRTLLLPANAPPYPCPQYPAIFIFFLSLDSLRRPIPLHWARLTAAWIPSAEIQLPKSPLAAHAVPSCPEARWGHSPQISVHPAFPHTGQYLASSFPDRQWNPVATPGHLLSFSKKKKIVIANIC